MAWYWVLALCVGSYVFGVFSFLIPFAFDVKKLAEKLFWR